MENWKGHFVTWKIDLDHKTELAELAFLDFKITILSLGASSGLTPKLLFVLKLKRSQTENQHFNYNKRNRLLYFILYVLRSYYICIYFVHYILYLFKFFYSTSKEEKQYFLRYTISTLSPPKGKKFWAY